MTACEHMIGQWHGRSNEESLSANHVVVAAYSSTRLLGRQLTLLTSNHCRIHLNSLTILILVWSQCFNVLVANVNGAKLSLNASSSRPWQYTHPKAPLDALSR